MVLTINDTFTEVSLTSDILLSTNQSVDVVVTFNCTTDYALSFVSTDDPIVIVPSDVAAADKFPDGVYNFKLTVTNVSGNILTESKCIFVNSNSSCLMIDTYKLVSSTNIVEAEEALKKVLSFEALLLAGNCTSCSCSSMCDLYNSTGLTNITNASDCGCS